MESKRLEIYSRIVFALIVRIVLNVAASYVPILTYVATFFGFALIVYGVLMLRTPAMNEVLLKGERKIGTVFYLYSGVGLLSAALELIYAFNLTSTSVFITTVVPSIYLVTLVLNVILLFLFIYLLSVNIKIVKSVV